MKVERLTPILNVSDIKTSFAWFEKLGWIRWDWVIRQPSGGVCNGSKRDLSLPGWPGFRGGPLPRHLEGC